MPRLLLIVVLVVAVAWLGFQAVGAFDKDRHAREAAAVLSAPDTVTHPLAAAPDRRTSPSDPDAGAPEREGNRQPGEALDAVHSPGGRFSHRPGTWLSVVELEGLDQVAGDGVVLGLGQWDQRVDRVAGDERYLVFLRNWAGWTLAGAARLGPDGTAQVRSAAEPRPATVYEVVVTRAVDDATSIPHGQPVLQWFDASLGPPRARRFDFAKGV